jgi:hypothetical protein
MEQILDFPTILLPLLQASSIYAIQILIQSLLK